MPIYFVDEGSSKACTLSEGSSQEPQLSCGGDPAVDVSIEEHSGKATVHIGTETIDLPGYKKEADYFIARSINGSAARFRVLDATAVAKLIAKKLGPITLAITPHVGIDITPKSIFVA